MMPACLPNGDDAVAIMEACVSLVAGEFAGAVGAGVFPMERLKELARRAYKEGRYHEGGGDRGDYDNILIPLKWIIE